MLRVRSPVAILHAIHNQFFSGASSPQRVHLAPMGIPCFEHASTDMEEALRSDGGPLRGYK
uniref:Cytochrome c oxidase subunit 6a n=1 Tax=Rhizophora mucronata TaxID=61149 RepID=A0A2P2JTS0_RHIMU